MMDKIGARPALFVVSRIQMPSAEAAAHSRQPTGRMVTAREVADAVCYLAGPSARSVTGADLALDGGMSSIRPE